MSKIIVSFKEEDPDLGSINYLLQEEDSRKYSLYRENKLVCRIKKKGKEFIKDVFKNKNYLLLDDLTANKAVEFLQKNCGA